MMKRKVLVVDDNPKNLQVIAALLSQNNYAVEVALNGKSAIKWLSNTDFDAVLLDVMMPELNGFETCEIIKRSPEHTNLPIIFLTARHDIESITEGFEKGGVDYITKPFNHQELLVRLDTHIELKQSREKLVDVNKWLTSEVEKKTMELQEANEQLLQLDKAKSDFLNSISHELRTPLNGIVGSINLLKALKHEEHTEEILSLLYSSVSNLEKYSYAALQISSLQLKGDASLKLQPTNILPIVHSLVDRIMAKSEKEELEFCFNADREELVVNVDYTFIQNALNSLFECSLTFTAKGKIEVEICSQGEESKIIIKDTGSLYEGQELNHFFKSISNQNHQFLRNNAIELYLAKTIILLHKGSIEFKNKEDGSGTITTIKLPTIKSYEYVD